MGRTAGKSVRLILALGVIGLWLGALDGRAAQEQEGGEATPPAFEDYLEAAQPGDLVRVELLSGGSWEGQLVSREGGEIIVKVNRVDMRLKADEVRRLVRLKSPAERFDDMRAATGDRDEAGLLALARWAVDEGLYDRALGVVGGVLEFNPTSREAITMNRDVAFLLKLRQDAGEPAPEDLTDERRAELAALRIVDFPYLTDEQVNLIKVYELDLRDPPRVKVPQDAVNALLEEYRDHPLIPTTEEGRRAFRKLPDAEILDIIYRVQARELYPRVSVVGQLESMQLFRDRINAGWLTRSCGTTDCHGGLNGGRFLISNRWRRTERGMYTNFHILNTFETSDGLPMIDAEEPRLSALLQMGLPRETALWPHPEVLGWRPTFRSEEDRWFVRTVEWISGLYTPRPTYELDYVLPGDRPRDELRGLSTGGGVPSSR
ncbi:MAG: hypothetical protein Tsb0013_16960 [Phycisphaerales bacterium]